jgi:hypothetical protein
MKSKKIDKKIFEALRDKATLSTNKGNFDRTKSIKPNSKTRRHSGREEIYIDDEEYPYQEVFWNDWGDYRDGQRNIKTQEIKQKIKKKQEIRKSQKNKYKINTT